MRGTRAALPRDTGNEYGETVIAERKIRVSSLSTPVSRLTDTSRFVMSGRMPSAFGRMNEDPDEQRLEQIRLGRMREAWLILRRGFSRTVRTASEGVEVVEHL